MRHFLALARGEESSLCTLDEGIAVQELIEKIKLSASTSEQIAI
jgi:predicted dehydrogenase